MPVRVKICGITNLPDALAAIEAGADALGFMLYEKSKRFIAMEAAVRIVEALPPFVQSVAVTVNATREFTNLGWRKQLKTFGAAQLHGQESPTHVRAVSKYLPVVKALPAHAKTLVSAGIFLLPAHMQQTMDKLEAIRAGLGKNLGRDASLEEISEEAGLPAERVASVLGLAENIPRAGEPMVGEYSSLVSAFLLDTPSQEHGGTGRAFDWNLAVEFKRHTAGKPLVLSGGLNPGNVAKAIEMVQPYAVDVSSGVEATPGRKDHAKLRDFIRICKSL